MMSVGSAEPLESDDRGPSATMAAEVPRSQVANDETPISTDRQQVVSTREDHWDPPWASMNGPPAGDSGVSHRSGGQGTFGADPWSSGDPWQGSIDSQHRSWNPTTSWTTSTWPWRGTTWAADGSGGSMAAPPAAASGGSPAAPGAAASTTSLSMTSPGTGPPANPSTVAPAVASSWPQESWRRSDWSSFGNAWDRSDWWSSGWQSGWWQNQQSGARPARGQSSASSDPTSGSLPQPQTQTPSAPSQAQGGGWSSGWLAGSGGWSSSPWGGWQSSPSWNWSSAGFDGSSKPDYSDPPSWPGWNYRKYWTAAIRRWNKFTDVPVHKRAEKVLRVLGWEMMADFEHLSEAELADGDYLERIISVLENKAGVREDDEKRKAIRAVMQESNRKKDETLAQYAVRREREFTKASSFGLDLPASLRSTLLREGALLSEQSQQNLVALLQGQDENPLAMAKALSRLDVRGDRLIGFVEDEVGDPSFLEKPEDEEDSYEEDTEAEEAIAAELDSMNLNEDQVAEVYAVLDSRRRRTWKENKLFKAEAKKDRGSFVKSEAGTTAPKGRFGGTPGTGFKGNGGRRNRMNREQLKKISTCRRCHKKGHWEEDCKEPPPASRVSTQKVQGLCFSYMGGGEASGVSSFSFMAREWISQQVRQTAQEVLSREKQVEAALEALSFLTIPSGEAILDIGATQDLIGEQAASVLEKQLENVGLKTVEVPTSSAIPSGIGGPARVKRAMLVPVSIGGVPGVLYMTVLAANIPPLLSVGFLEHLGAKIDLINNVALFQSIEVSVGMRRLSTGHRCIPIVSWNGGTFPIPQEAVIRHKLKPGAFDLKPSVSSFYLEKDAQSFMNYHVSWHESTRSTTPTTTIHEPNDFEKKNMPLLHRVIHECVPCNADHDHEIEMCGVAEKKFIDELDSVDGSAQNTPLSSALITQVSNHSMGGKTTKPLTQFAGACALISHGCPCPEPHHPGSQHASDEPLASSHGETALRLGGHPGHVFQVDHGGDPAEKHQVGPQLLCHSDLSDQPRVSASRAVSPQEGKSICLMDLVRELRCSPELSEEILRQGEAQGQNASSPCLSSQLRSRSTQLQPHIDPLTLDTINRDDESSHGKSHDSSISCVRVTRNHSAGSSSGDQHGAHDAAVHVRPHPSEPGDAPCNDSGGSDSARPFPGTRTDAVFHATEPQPADVPGGDSGVRSSSVRLNGDDGGTAERLGGDDEPEPGERERPMMWPDWMRKDEVESNTRMLTPNMQSEELKNTWVSEAHRSDSYVFYMRAEQVPGDPVVSAEDKRGMREMFIPAGSRILSEQYKSQSTRPQSTALRKGDVILWRETVDVLSGDFIEKTPYPGRCHCDLESEREVKTSWWFLPRELRSIHGWASQVDEIKGMNAEGKESAEGPFWLVHSISLSQQLGEDEGRERSADRLGSDFPRCRRALSFMMAPEEKHLSQLDFIEIFSPHRVPPYAQKLGLKTAKEVYDLQSGWDVRKAADRQAVREVLYERRPKMAMFSPECKAYSQLMSINWDKMQPGDIQKILAEGKLMWNFSLEGAHEQLNDGRDFGLEHPAGASSWKLPQSRRLLQDERVALMTFDQCALGLSVEPGHLSKKPTRIATSNPFLACLLAKAQCDLQHEHLHLEHGRAAAAQVYPPRLCEVIAQSTWERSRHHGNPSFLAGFEGEIDEIEDEENPTEIPRQEGEAHERRVSEQQKRLITKVHVNTGHPPQEQFLRMMRAAGAHEHVLKYIKEEFNCDQCSMKNKPSNRRRAHCPRSFSFNKVLSIDVFYVKFMSLNVPILNMVCNGTNYHVVQRLRIPENLRGGTPTSSTTWKAFLETWVRFLGAPFMIVTDSGLEFRGRFERGCESLGVLQHVIAPECPWENAKSERHGGWVKEKLDKEILSGNCTFTSLEELDEYLATLTSVKNRWYSRGGYTPTSLVFGELPRVPDELLSDDHPGLCGLDDALQDPHGADEASREYRRRHEIRERARQAAMEQTSREAVHRAVKASTHQPQSWAPGQWVYVFRRGRPNQELHPRNRWVGPGVVLLANNRIVYVAMRTRLWRCAPEQLRPALPAEVLGRELATDPGIAELVRQVTSGIKTGAVDVAREGSPPPDDASTPIERVEGAGQVQLSEADAPERGMPSMAEPVQVPSAPELVPAVPPGLVQSSSPPRPRAPSDPWPDAHSPRPVSRQITEEEPAAEPIVAGPPPGLETINEDAEEDSGIRERERKVARLSSPERVGGSSSSASTTGPMTRAPGTPVDRLLSGVPRNRTPSPTRPVRPENRLTPVEELSRRTVRERVDEFERLRDRSPRRRPDDEGDQALQFFGFTHLGGERHSLQLLAKRGDEISLKDLSQEEKTLFDKSDKVEWDAILGTKAVKILVGKEAQKMRELYPDRIVSSRMVRRKKPLPEMHKWKAKSRWCLHGHADPDTGDLVTYAPTPQAEGMAMFLQVAVNYGFLTSFGDVKNAFCQSRPLARKRGPLFAEPCEGLHLPPGALIEIVVPVYGLDDAPASWRLTVTEFLVQEGFIRNLVEPCWFTLFNEDQSHPVCQVLIEVDDFIVSCHPTWKEKIKQKLTSRFAFGKWENDEAEYAGRHVRCTNSAIYIDQEKYVTEQIHPILLPKGRKSAKDQKLSPEEFQSFRSLIYKINWVARETRPEVAGTASIMASRHPSTTIQDIITVNKVVNFLRSTASRPLTIWKFPPEEMCFMMVSDAGGVNTKEACLDEDGLPADATQGAWMVLTCAKLPCGTAPVKASPITWRSAKLKRKVFSTFGGETQAMLQGVNEVDWLQIMYKDATSRKVELRSWRSSLSPHLVVMRGDITIDHQPQVAVTDAKSLYDCLLREHPSGKQDRKSALELAIILKDLQETKSMLRWVPHQKMLVDVLTKNCLEKGNGALLQFLRTGWISFVDVQQELQNRKEDVAYRRRSSKACTERLQKEYSEQLVAFCDVLATLIGGYCKDDHMSPLTTDCQDFHVPN